MVKMIIKGLFRRYERWNPVHPTSGAFWGMGLGIGCGVGWGPGFGPEAIGYVGAGCGVGFSVGLTLAGFGIGLPANNLLRFPCDALVATSSGLLMVVRSSGLLFGNDLPRDGSSNIASHFSPLQRETSARFSDLKKSFMDKGADLCDMKHKFSEQTLSFSKDLGTFCQRIFDHRKGLGD